MLSSTTSDYPIWSAGDQMKSRLISNRHILTEIFREIPIFPSALCDIMVDYWSEDPRIVDILNSYQSIALSSTQINARIEYWISTLPGFELSQIKLEIVSYVRNEEGDDIPVAIRSSGLDVWHYVLTLPRVDKYGCLHPWRRSKFPMGNLVVEMRKKLYSMLPEMLDIPKNLREEC